MAVCDVQIKSGPLRRAGVFFCAFMIRNHTAIVLRTTPFQEGALVVSFLSEFGERLVGLAKGARKPSAKWVSRFEPLTLVQMSLFGKEQTGLGRITRCEIQHSPMTLGHLESHMVVACLADLFDRVAHEGVEDDRLFRLLSASSRALKADPNRAMAILAYVEFWLLHCLGLMPSAKACNICQNVSAPLVMLCEDHGWRCAACTSVEPGEAFPVGVREHVMQLRKLGVQDAPDPKGSDAAHCVTLLLRSRLIKELGGRVGSYDVMQQVLGG